MSGPSTSTPGSTMSSTLWAHLLNKDAAASGSGLKTSLVTSVGPSASAFTDRAGTSVRILLHDTQATIEKFSERVDKLISEAEDSRQKLLARNEEVNDEVERLIRRVVQEQGKLLLPGLCRRPPYPQILGCGVKCPQTNAHILTLIIYCRQWVEQKQFCNHISGNQLRPPSSLNCGNPFQARWMP